jgi:single-strand DNA-binding protein
VFPAGEFSGPSLETPRKGQEEQMSSFNRVLLIGNLTRDPELRHTPQGKAVCEFTLAVDGVPRSEGEKSADYFPITVWEKRAEACAKHLRKGSLVHVEARLKQERWEAEGGEKRSRLALVAHSVSFLHLGTKEESGEPVGVPSGTSAEPGAPEADVPF